LSSLAVVRDLRVARAPVTAADLAALETDVLAGFVLARAAAGLADGTIASDVMHLEQIRTWFGRPLWDMEPSDADVYFGKILRRTAKGTRLSRAHRGGRLPLTCTFSRSPNVIPVPLFIALLQNNGLELCLAANHIAVSIHH
jgi:hypothetical protein